MSAKKPPATIEALRRQVAAAEAALGTLRAKLAKAEAAASGEPAPVCGLDLLWDAALPMSRTRSSKHRCRQAWARLPIGERPPVPMAVAALKAWNRCDEWRKSDSMFAPGLHRFISERMWEALPEGSKADPLARYRCQATPAAPVDPADTITDPAEIAALLSLKPQTTTTP